MTVLSDDDWREVEHAYLNTKETVASIAERFDITMATLNNRRIAQDWMPRRPKAIKIHDGSVPEKTALKASVVARFYRLIHLKLEHMEADMARSSERTPADNERETRALGSLIRNFDKVFGLDQDGGGENDKQNRNGTESNTEAEALRRELAERLVRIRNAGKDDDGATG